MTMKKTMSLLVLSTALITGGTTASATTEDLKANTLHQIQHANGMTKNVASGTLIDQNTKPPVKKIMRDVKDALIQKANKNNRVVNYETKKSLINAWSKKMDQGLANRIANRFYMIRSGELYLKPQCFMPWFDADNNYQMNAIDESHYKLKQTNQNDMFGTYTFEVMLEKQPKAGWKVMTIEINDVRI